MGFGFYKQYKIENCKLKEKWKIISFYQFYYEKARQRKCLKYKLKFNKNVV